MLVCGVICEYDPFHNGHAYHLRALRKKTGCQWIVCVMSGHFTQRGHAAILSKWARAEMALRCGADAVFELPALFAVRDAERFAMGGVSLLDGLGIVTHLGFGSESGNLDELLAQSKIEGNLTVIRRGLAHGMTLARARGEAAGLTGNAPNDILAVEYLRALQALRSDIVPVAIRRSGHGYHDEALGEMASATAVRSAIRQGMDVYAAMPPAAYALLKRLQAAGAVQQPGGLDTALLALLRSTDAATLAQTADIGEGLENRLLRAAQEASTREALINQVKCKRYTWARLSRIATQALLGITKQMTAAQPLPAYARLLGFRREAQPLLNEIKKNASLPIVVRAAKHRIHADAGLSLDIHAGDLWTLGLENPALRAGHIDLTENVLLID